MRSSTRVSSHRFPFIGLLLSLGALSACVSKEEQATSEDVDPTAIGGDEGGGEDGGGDDGGGDDGGDDGGGDDGGGEDGGDTGTDPVDADGDGYTTEDGDCDDTDPEVNPAGVDDAWNNRDCDWGVDRSQLDTRISGSEGGRTLGYAVGLMPDVDGDGGAEIFATTRTGASFSAHVWHGGDLSDGAQLTEADAVGTVQLPLVGSLFPYATHGGDVLDTGGPTMVLIGAGLDGTHPTIYLVDLLSLAAGESLVPSDLPRLLGDDLSTGSSTGQGMTMDVDLDGDGFDDLVLGSPSAAGGRVDVHLAASLQASPVRYTSDADLQIDSDIDGNLGGGISSAGDIDGDGYDDVFVGAPYYTVEGAANYNGVSFIFSGAELAAGTVDSTDDALVRVVGNVGESMGGQGRIIADVTGDGESDVVFSAWAASSGLGALQGSLWIFDRDAVEPGTLALEDAFHVVYGGRGIDQIGWFSYHDIPDLDGDGQQELFIAGQGDGGSQYILSRSAITEGGTTDLVPESTLHTWHVPETLYQAHSDAVFGDIDGDGESELLLQGAFDDLNGDDSGSLYRLPARL